MTNFNVTSDDTIDLEEWLAYLEESNDSEEDKLELLRLIWNIVSDIAAIGHGVHPVQQVEGCGQNGKTLANSKTQSQIPLESQGSNLVGDFYAAKIEEDNAHA